MADFFPFINNTKMFCFWLLACKRGTLTSQERGIPESSSKILLSGNIYQHLKKGEATICIRSMAGPKVYERTFRCSLEHSSSWTLCLCIPNFLDEFPYTDDWWLPCFWKNSTPWNNPRPHFPQSFKRNYPQAQPNLTMPPFMPNLVIISNPTSY